MFYSADLMRRKYFRESRQIHKYRFVADILIEFAVVDSKKAAGYYSSILSIVYWIARAAACLFFWTDLSNRVGRQTCIVWGQCFNVLISFLLCFTNNYWYLLGLITFAGFASSNMSLVAAALGERTKNGLIKLRSYALLDLFAIVGFMLSSGVLSGFLSRPVLQYSSWRIWGNGFLNNFFSTFPAFAVYFAIGVFQVIGLVVVCFVKETNPSVLFVRNAKKFDEKDTEELKKKLVEGIGESFCSRVFAPLNALFASSIARPTPILVLIAHMLQSAGSMLFNMVMPLIYSLELADGGFGFSNYQIGIVGWLSGAMALVVCILGFSIVGWDCTPKNAAEGEENENVTPCNQRWYAVFIHSVWVLRLCPVLFSASWLASPTIAPLFGMGKNATIRGWVFLVILVIVDACNEYVYIHDMTIQSNTVAGTDYGSFNGFCSFLEMLGRGFGPQIGAILFSAGLSVNVFPIDIHLCLILGVGCHVAVSILMFFVPLRLINSYDSDKTGLEGVGVVGDGICQGVGELLCPNRGGWKCCSTQTPIAAGAGGAAGAGLPHDDQDEYEDEGGRVNQVVVQTHQPARRRVETVLSSHHNEFLEGASIDLDIAKDAYRPHRAEPRIREE